MTNCSKVLIYFTLISFFLHYLEESLRTKKKNFGTVYHTEVCLTFSRLAAKLSGVIAKFRGCSLKIHHKSSFDLNGLKNDPALHFKNSLKSIDLFQRLMRAMNCRSRSQKPRKSSAAFTSERLVVAFNVDNQDAIEFIKLIDFTKLSNMTICRAS